MTPDSHADAIVIGAGVSGLIAARTVQASGTRVLVLDKGRGVGGRLATRRTDSGVFDHGAQFFTARDPQFRLRVEAWQAAGIVRPWATGFVMADGTFKREGETRFCGVTGMTAISKHLAQGLDVRLNARVTCVQTEGTSWVVKTEAGERLSGCALLLTPPMPQSLQLLAAGDVPLPEQIRGDLEQINYAPCLAVLAQLAGASLIPEPGGLWFAGEPISWMADNQRKGVSLGLGAAITIHAGPQFSQAHWATPEAEVTAALLAVAAPWLGSVPVQTQLHRWRYSLPLRTHPERCVVLRERAPLVFAGDAFGGPRVEGAALSGLAAGAALAELLSGTLPS
ncbi:MAG: FAD-dependent oxidoreductase [Verrucomicrobia bacterium]|nr:FAD-dependent oxidoreductase [Verrucomicrobiota bacterium]